MGDSQYSFSLITFSPTGKLVQIKHAMTAVRSSQTSLGIKVEWVLTFEFWFGKVRSKQNNIIDCTRGVRPFGVSLLVSSFDDNGLRLYQVDPSGSYFSWKALAIEKNVSKAKTFGKQYHLKLVTSGN